MKSLFIGFNAPLKGLSVLIIYIFLLSGCATIGHQDDEAMYMKASALTKLSAAVEGTVRYEGLPANLSDDALLKLSIEDDPDLLEPFNGYLLKVNKNFRHAIVLLCSPDGTQGLLEDAGCTAKMDVHLWQQKMPCAFTLSADKVCISD